MKFLVRERKRKAIRSNIRRKLIVSFTAILAISYCLSCLWLYSRQEVILYRANDKIAHSDPSDRDFQLDFQDVWLNVANSPHRLHGWWFPTPDLRSEG